MTIDLTNTQQLIDLADMSEQMFINKYNLNGADEYLETVKSVNIDTIIETCKKLISDIQDGTMTVEPKNVKDSVIRNYAYCILLWELARFALAGFPVCRQLADA
jgi:hypothetical protein